ncbi:hypothetical protein [Arcticibacter eurypsychrophilus]|uniref:hypothetical protein n=1 Tax=Arcticibacter eurypsychrophilus TaxID=1434752 RepID=UPI00084E0106|nr:hypothetical protein [Arcticibacter eurypsychrophilus]
MTTIDSALQDIMQLDYNSREMLLVILQKRQIEARREDIAKSAKQSLKDYHAGKSVPLDAKEVNDRLNSL